MARNAALLSARAARMAVAGLMVLVVGVTAHPAAAQLEIQLVDLDFPGGSVAQYVQAIRKAASGANIVMTPDGELVHLEPVKLTDVDMRSALYLLDGLEAELPDRYIQLDLQEHITGHGSPVYVLSAESKPRRAPGRATSPTQSGVWSVGRILEHGIDPEHIATAIDTALELFGDDYAPAQVRFHPESGLVLARGHVEQINAIESVIGALMSFRPGEDLEAELDALRREAEGEIDALRARCEDFEGALQQMTRELTEWQTRAEMYVRQLDDARNETARAREEAAQARAERDSARMQVDREYAAKMRAVDADRGEPKD